MTGFFEMLQKQEGTPVTALKYLSTHPTASDRIARLKRMASDWRGTPIKLLPGTDWAGLAKLC
jgi:predicted Zn-dependent protease